WLGLEASQRQWRRHRTGTSDRGEWRECVDYAPLRDEGARCEEGTGDALPGRGRCRRAQRRARELASIDDAGKRTVESQPIAETVLADLGILLHCPSHSRRSANSCGVARRTRSSKYERGSVSMAGATVRGFHHLDNAAACRKAA